MAAWISEWLHNRKESVVLNGDYFRLQDILSSVLQGFVLGPLFFSYFVNGIDILIYTRIQKLADDYKMYLSVPSATNLATLR